MVAEASKTGGAVCAMEEYRQGMVRNGTQAWHWRPHGYIHQ